MQAIIRKALLVLLLVCSSAASAARPAGFDPKSLPLFTEGKTYLGQYETGLYPGGSNEMPRAHLEAGLRISRSIRALDREGKVDEKNGRIVALVKGHSNTTLYFTNLQGQLRTHAPEWNDRFVLVVGSVASQQLPEILRLQGPVWEKSDRYLQRAGCTRAQVQVLFLHTTFNGPGNRSGNGPPPPPFPESMRRCSAACPRC